VNGEDNLVVEWSMPINGNHADNANEGLKRLEALEDSRHWR
jgi:hypothetical protein